MNITFNRIAIITNNRIAIITINQIVIITSNIIAIITIHIAYILSLGKFRIETHRDNNVRQDASAGQDTICYSYCLYSIYIYINT